MPDLHFFSRRIPAALLAAVLLAAVLLTAFSFACGGEDAAAPEPTSAPAEAVSELSEHPKNWSVVSDDIGAELATPDLGVGR